ncbi:hypothetical protein [Thermanaeromonas toyohensis]|nr:hypothetical protein [Thermanaeromonas toyohensis]
MAENLGTGETVQRMVGPPGKFSVSEPGRWPEGGLRGSGSAPDRLAEERGRWVVEQMRLGFQKKKPRWKSW